MSQLFSSCSRYREQISLLASKALPDNERAGLDGHLTVCEDCRRYRDEIGSIAASLLDWKQSFGSLEPGEAALARWEKDLAQRIKPGQPSGHRFSRLFLDWCKDMIWPSRRIWAGLAAVWVIILAVNLSQRSPIHDSVAKSISPSPELVRAFFEGGGFIDQPIPPAERNVEPSSDRGPRSERNSGVVTRKAI